MILIDINQIAISNMMQAIKQNNIFDIKLLRHMILTAIRSFKNRFSDEYGDVILCSDANRYWRKTVFPYYKANRKKVQAESGIDWNLIFIKLNLIKTEIQENMPYKFMVVPHCEADDIIAVISSNTTEPVLIISSDKDFIQLHKYKHVTQYSPIQKKFLVVDDPVLFLEDKIIHGDVGDGIPNILSDDDTFIAGKRQNRITSKFVESFNKYTVATNYYQKYDRNNTLINFDCIPMEIRGQILLEYDKPVIGSSDKATKYLMRNGLKVLLWNGEL